jgi:hypothetical protein
MMKPTDKWGYWQKMIVVCFDVVVQQKDLEKEEKSYGVHSCSVRTRRMILLELYDVHHLLTLPVADCES